MKKKRFSVEQIVAILKQAELGSTGRGADRLLPISCVLYVTLSAAYRTVESSTRSILKAMSV